MAGGGGDVPSSVVTDDLTGTCWRDDMWLAAFGLHHGNVLDYFVSGRVKGNAWLRAGMRKGALRAGGRAVWVFERAPAVACTQQVQPAPHPALPMAAPPQPSTPPQALSPFYDRSCNNERGFLQGKPRAQPP